MSEQEMQFADPEWQPGGQPQAADDPQVTHAWVNRPASRTQDDGPFAGPHDTISPYRQDTRAWSDREPTFSAYRPTSSYQANRQRALPTFWWIWLVIAIFFLTLLSSMFSASFSRQGGSQPAYPYGGGPGQHWPFEHHSQTQQFIQYNSALPSGVTLIQVNNAYGAVHVQVGDAATTAIEVRTDNPASNAVTFAQEHDTFSIVQDVAPSTGNEGDLLITLPPTQAALALTTTTGDIEVDGYSGQMTLVSQSGSLTLFEDTLRGNSALSTDAGNVVFRDGRVASAVTTMSSQSGYIQMVNASLSGQVTLSTVSGNGDIDYSGTLDPDGIYHFATSGGDIHLYLPADASMQIQHVSSPTGSYASDFPPTAGNAPHAHVFVQTNNGSIYIYNQDN